MSVKRLIYNSHFCPYFDEINQISAKTASNERILEPFDLIKNDYSVKNQGGLKILTPLTGLAALNQFCASAHFHGLIYIQVSWNHRDKQGNFTVNPPANWEKGENGELINYIYSGNITSNKFLISRCEPLGKDFQGNTIWKPTGKQLNGFEYLKTQAEDGATIYFYPNQPSGGISNAHVGSSHLLFYEIDNLPLDEQWKRLNDLETLTALKPCAVVFSGGKSLHVYFRLSQQIDAETHWRRLNRKLTVIQQSDPAINNPARAMRLPGMVRRKANNGQLTESINVSLEQWSDSVYTPEEFEKALDATGLFPYGLSYSRWLKWRWERLHGTIEKARAILNTPEEELTPKYDLPKLDGVNYNGEHIPLEWCLSRNDKALLASGVDEGSRDDSAYKLARNLIGTANELSRLGFNYSGDPYSLFDEFCSKCSPSLPERDRQRIWKSANRGNPTGSLPTAIIEDIVSRYVATPEKRARHSSRNTPSLPGEIDQQTWELVHGLPGFFKRQLAKIKRKFSGKNRETQKNLLFSQPDLIFTEAQNRAELMIKGFQSGRKYIHFGCHGGVGKSHFIGLLTTERFKEAGIDCDGIINCSRSGRDPATKTIEGNFHEVRVRAESMAVDPHRKTPLGHPILVHPTPENPGTVAGNCHLAEQFRIAAAKGYDVEGVKGCAKFGCKYYDFNPIDDTCGKSSSDGYGFRNQHKQDLAHPRIRCNIASIPDDPDYLKKKLLILDEPGQIISGVKVQELALEDLAQAQALIMTFYPEYRPILDEPLAQLHRFAVAETLPYYGADIQQIRNNISIPENKRQPILNACADIDKKQSDKLNSKTLHTAPKLWLSKFFRVLLSEEPGAIRIEKKQVKDKKGNVKTYISLTITTVDERLRNILNNVLGVVFLDGTATKQSLADTLGINPDQILQLERIPPDYSNYTVKVITGLGNCGGANPSAQMQARKNALAQQFIKLHGTDAPILDRQGREQKWWVDNRLQNRDAGKPARLSFGTPYQNLGALQDRFITLKGKYYKLGGANQCDATDPELQAEINRTVQAEFIQDAWRLRSHRYPDKQFTQYYVTDFDFSFIKDELPGVKLETIDAFAFTPEAGDALQQTKWHITQEFQKLVEQGRDIATITQKEIAEAVNKSLVYLKKIVSAFGGWQKFKQGILALLATYSGSIPLAETLTPEELQWFGETWLPLLAGEIRQGNYSAFEDIGNILKIYGVKAFHLVCRYCDSSVRSDILMGILQLIPLNQLSEIWQTD